MCIIDTYNQASIKTDTPVQSWKNAAHRRLLQNLPVQEMISGLNRSQSAETSASAKKTRVNLWLNEGGGSTSPIHFDAFVSPADRGDLRWPRATWIHTSHVYIYYGWKPKVADPVSFLQQFCAS